MKTSNGNFLEYLNLKIACLFLLLWATGAHGAPAPLCEDVFSESSLEAQAIQSQREALKDFDDQQYRKVFYSHLRNQKKTAVSQLNQATLGIFADLFEFKWSPDQKKVILVPRVEMQNILRPQVEKKLARARLEDIEQVKAMVSDALVLTKVSEEMILVKASLVSFKFLSGFHQAILHRYQKMGFRAVDFVYRYSGLEKKHPTTGAVLLDEVVSILKEGRGYNIHLAFDPKIWSLEMQLVASEYRRYQEAQSAEEKEKIISELTGGLDPFQPLSGVVTTDSLVPTARATEIKRYFSNPFEDPLHFVDLPQRNEYLMRLKMLVHIIGHLRPDTPLEIHAHSTAHKRAYVKLGFRVYAEEQNPLYPGVQVYILRGDQSEVLKKITEILNKS